MEVKISGIALARRPDFVDNLFRELMQPVAPLLIRSGALDRASPFASTIAVDLVDTDTHYELQCDVPGYAKDEIHISVQEKHLTIEVAKNAAPTQSTAQSTADATAVKPENIAAKDNAEQEPVKRGTRTLLSERLQGRMRRTLVLPEPIDEAGAVAHYANGVLTLSLPKVAKPTVRRISVA